MGYWVVQKKRNLSLIVGIVGLALALVGFLVIMSVYFYQKAR